MASLRGSSPPSLVLSMVGENTQMVDIEQPHKHDVLCGRGVTTNRFPGNESFRALVSLNKELYVTSTKRQKMSISRSIVEAVRSLKPPGRFLEKNPATGLWSDIGDRKAIEKTSQALRDGAAGLRKELTEDLRDPDFISAVFDVDAAAAKSGSKAKPASPTIKDKDKPVKAKPVKRGHRRTKSNPSAVAKAAAKSLKKQASQGKAEAASIKSPSRSSSLPPRAPLSPVSPRSRMGSPPPNGWPMHFPPGGGHPGCPYPPDGAMHFKSGRPYRSHSYQMTPPHHGPPRPPHPPHSWSHAPPRHPGPASPQTVVHTPQSPLPPGRHQLTPNGCISKPPLSPVTAPPRWSPRPFPRHLYPPPPDYAAFSGRPDYHPGRPDYGRGHPGAEFWPPHRDHHRRSRHYYHRHRDYYRDYPFPPFPPGSDGLDVPSLGGERGYCHDAEEESVQQEFSPPVTPSRRRKSDKMSSSPASGASSSRKSNIEEDAGKKTTAVDRMSDASEETTRSSVVVPIVEADKIRSSSKDDATQNTAMMSPVSVAEGEEEGGDRHDNDVKMEDCRSPSSQNQEEPPPLKRDVHVISIVHKVGDHTTSTGEREESIEFILKDQSSDDYSLSPLPFEEREDPSSLMELPDDILHLPISSCGPQDD